MNLVRDFSMLFGGRQDAYGEDSGACHRVPEPAVWDDLWDMHLAHLRPLGIYPMVFIEGQWMVRWGCIDLDVQSFHHKTYDFATQAEAHDKARDIQAALRLLGLYGWIERTRSDGRHVWVFAEGWITARIMRRALQVACQTAGFGKVREINPKQEALAEGQLGNYVRIPYGTDDTQYVLTSDSTRLPLEQFVMLAMDRRAEYSTLNHAASLYVEPVIYTAYEPPTFHGEPTSKDDAYLRTVLANGPRDGQDRSGWLSFVAHECKRRGLSQHLAFSWVELADRSVEKYTNRPDREKRLNQIVALAYGR
jgi:hypothetical protein